MTKSTKKEKVNEQSEYNLPKYLLLNKGAMWFDTEGTNSSGVKLYSTNKILVGRDTKLIDNSKYRPNFDEPSKSKLVKNTDIPKDNFSNNDLLNYGWVEQNLPWYFDTTQIPKNKLSRILLAYKHGILAEANPDKPPVVEKELGKPTDFTLNKDGDRIFSGRNKEMYSKLQNLSYSKLKEFINTTPINAAGRSNLLDLLEYEQKGYNPLSRARLEVLDDIKKKLKEFGPGMSAIRINDI